MSLFEQATKKMLEDFLRKIRRDSQAIADQRISTYFHGIISPSGTVTPTALPPASRGYYEPITNGDPIFPEVLFDGNGDILMTQVIP